MKRTKRNDNLLSKIVVSFWSWWRDLNPRPIDYESIALPLRHTSIIKFDFVIILYETVKVKSFFEICPYDEVKKSRRYVLRLLIIYSSSELSSNISSTSSRISSTASSASGVSFSSASGSGCSCFIPQKEQKAAV